MLERAAGPAEGLPLLTERPFGYWRGSRRALFVWTPGLRPGVWPSAGDEVKKMQREQVTSRACQVQWPRVGFCPPIKWGDIWGGQSGGTWFLKETNTLQAMSPESPYIWVVNFIRG